MVLNLSLHAFNTIACLPNVFAIWWPCFLALFAYRTFSQFMHVRSITNRITVGLKNSHLVLLKVHVWSRFLYQDNILKARFPIWRWLFPKSFILLCFCFSNRSICECIIALCCIKISYIIQSSLSSITFPILCITSFNPIIHLWFVETYAKG